MKRPRLLVVDDDAGMLYAIERVLDSRYDVFTASCAEDALQPMDEPFDAAILDIRMPGMDGFELMSRLKERQSDLDVILMTGSLSEPDAHFIRAIREKAFYFIEKPFDREVLASLVERCLELRRFREDNRRHLRRLERELDQARSFQQSLFPQSPRRFGTIEIEARCLLCDDLGGDFFDYAVASGDRVAFVVVDVAGHGVSAAMLTAMVKAAFSAAHVDDYAPRAILQRIHDGIRPFGYEKFLTCFCGRLDPADGTLEYVNAAHPPGIVRRTDGTLQLLAPTGTIVSPVLCDRDWPSTTTRLGPGERLLVISDGVAETPDATEFFGDARVLDLVERHGTRPALVTAVLDALESFSGGRPPVDDRTVFSITRTA